MDNLIIYIFFTIFLAAFVIIGLMSKMKSQPTSADYLLASHDLKPWLVALSAVATNNSGYMFIGMIGFTYTVGLASVWLAVGWILGDLIVSLMIHKKLRINTEKSESLSYPTLLASWYPPMFLWVRRLAGIIILVFLGTYAGAQLNAGSKALHVLFGWPYATGAIIGSVIILIYCYAGGIRASVWTDAAQSFVMVLAMALMCYLSFEQIGFNRLSSELVTHTSPSYFNWFQSDLMFGPFIGPLLFVIGWLFAGFAVAGQPHIMIRFMMLDSAHHMTRVRFYYYSWYVVFFALTILTAIGARMLIQDTNFDAELALPMMAMELFPAPITGLVLAGLFAATMSTADSQILSCSAALTKDIFSLQDHYWINKAATIFVTFLALSIALMGNKNVFSLVVFAWAVLGAAFMPIMSLYAMKIKVNEPTACMMMIGGSATVIVWSQFPISETLYSACAGIVASFLIFGASALVQKMLGIPLQQAIPSKNS